MTDLHDFLTRYVATWNEPDEAARRIAIPEIWATDVSLYNRLREYHGHRGIEQATKRSCDLFTLRGYTFRTSRDPVSHHDGIRLDWEMLDPDGAIDTLGTQFLVLDTHRRVRLDYQFIEPPTAPDRGRR